MSVVTHNEPLLRTPEFTPTRRLRAGCLCSPRSGGGGGVGGWCCPKKDPEVGGVRLKADLWTNREGSVLIKLYNNS